MATDLHRAGALAALLALGCATSPYVDEGLEGLAITAIHPGVVVEGTALAVDGASFVAADWGTTSLRLRGTRAGDGGPRAVDVTLPARFVDFDALEVDVDAGAFADLGGDGDFAGDAWVEVVSGVDGEVYRAAPITAALSFRAILEPRLDTVQSGGVIFANDPIEVAGTGLLLGGNEGTTYAVVEGCFTADGDGSCVPVGPASVPVTPAADYDRSRGSFAFAPDIAGIRPGRFDGTVTLRNDHGAGPSRTSAPAVVGYDMVEPAIFEVSPAAASLGQYIDVRGGGFVGGADGDTTLRLVGTFTASGQSEGVAVDLVLVPAFASGRRVRYVVNEDDALGRSIDLRRQTGTFAGEVTPEIGFRGDRVRGRSASMVVAIAPVKQVVYLRFAPTYVESLRHFGLRAVDRLIRRRVAEVVARDYATINLEVRLEPVDDFALYAQVDVAGPDPNGLGLFGYDNTPGKDVGNQRLYDRIGGVNASTQEDGFPGFGGVFIESFFGFSMHPEGRAEALSGADPLFDDIFDPFRPDRGGVRVAAADLAGGAPAVAGTDGCPAADRDGQLACAIAVLGNLIGTTVSHEIGHSLGLANPYAAGFHHHGDAPNRLMDAGDARPFAERAELGAGPAVFCAEAYAYLRDILPAPGSDDASPRPGCL